MNKAIQIFEDALNLWRDNRGVGTFLIPPPLEDKVIVLLLLEILYNKNPDNNVLIIVNKYSERQEIIDYLTKQDNEENNKEFQKLINERKIKIWSNNYIQNDTRIEPKYLIIYHLDEYNDTINKLIAHSKFKLIILNKLLEDIGQLQNLYKNCQLLKSFEQKIINEVRCTTPVEEIWIDVTIPTDTEEFKLLEYYNNYINTSLTIFGSFDNMNYARVGDSRSNTSATNYCYRIAQENGWNEQLDMSNPIDIEIDNMFNPNNIKDRASQTYEIIRSRSELLSCYNGKLEEIYRIVKENEGKKILIINKKGKFATLVTTYINNLSTKEICANYHNDVETVPARDINDNLIYYKNGDKAGQLKYMGAAAQKTLNEQRFNAGIINILSTNAAIDKKLNIDVDIVIITSPECDTIEDYFNRLTNVNFSQNGIKLFSIFVKNSSEEKKQLNRPLSETHIVVNSEKMLNLSSNYQYNFSN